MSFWLILLIVAVAFLILEMFTPTLFFINFSVASAVSAYFAYKGFSIYVITFVFLFVSVIAIAFIRPLVLKSFKSKKQNTGMEDKYIGQYAMVVENVSKTGGRISIYGEEWQAKIDCEDNTVIPVGERVKIVSYDSIILTVENIKEC